MIDAIAAKNGEIRPLSLSEARNSAAPTWVRVSNATDEELDRVAEAFGIHPLAVEDLSGIVRTKTEQYPDYTFVLLKTAELAPGETTFGEELVIEPVEGPAVTAKVAGGFFSVDADQVTIVADDADLTT